MATIEDGGTGKLIVECCDPTGLDPALAAAVVLQESGGYRFAMRFERAFYERYLANKTRYSLLGFIPKTQSFETELMARATSFGLMQVMGEVARERGFAGESLGELLDPKTNLTVGCGFLSSLLAKKQGNVRAALLRYNGGANVSYADEVLARIPAAKLKYDL